MNNFNCSSLPVVCRVIVQTFIQQKSKQKTLAGMLPMTLTHLQTLISHLVSVNRKKKPFQSRPLKKPITHTNTHRKAAHHLVQTHTNTHTHNIYWQSMLLLLFLCCDWPSTVNQYRRRSIPSLSLSLTFIISTHCIAYSVVICTCFACVARIGESLCVRVCMCG